MQKTAAKDTLKPDDVAARNSLVELTSKIEAATRAIDSLEAVHDVIPVATMLKSLKKVAMKFSSIEAQKDAVSMFVDGQVAYSAYGTSTKPRPPPYKLKEGRKCRCKFYDAGICKFGDKCRWNHIDGDENNDRVGPHRQNSNNNGAIVNKCPCRQNKTSEMKPMCR